MIAGCRRQPDRSTVARGQTRNIREEDRGDEGQARADPDMLESTVRSRARTEKREA